MPSLKVCPSSIIDEPELILFALSKVSSTIKVGPAKLESLQFIEVAIPEKSNNLLPATANVDKPTGW